MLKGREISENNDDLMLFFCSCCILRLQAKVSVSYRKSSNCKIKRNYGQFAENYHFVSVIHNLDESTCTPPKENPCQCPESCLPYVQNKRSLNLS